MLDVYCKIEVQVKEVYLWHLLHSVQESRIEVMVENQTRVFT